MQGTHKEKAGGREEGERKLMDSAFEFIKGKPTAEIWSQEICN